MSTYEKTFASPESRVHYGDLNMDRVESETTKMWLGGTEGETRNSSWTSVTDSRNMGTIEVNDTESHRLVVATVHLNANAAAVGSTNEAKATAELGEDLSAAVDYTPGSVSQETGSETGRIRHFPLIFIVNPGEEYRIVDDSSGDASVDLDSANDAVVYEFDFDAVHVTQDYQHAENPFASKLNGWADAVNDAVQSQTTPDITSRGASDPSLDVSDKQVPSQVTLASTEVSVSNGGQLRTIQKDSGGSFGTTGRLSSQGSFSLSQTYPMFVNPDGTYDVVEEETDAFWDDNDEARFRTSSTITFVSGESGQSTGDKFRDLDGNASTGVNTKMDMNRVDAGTGTGSRTPSSTSLAFVLLHVRLEPTGTTIGEATIDAEGSTRALANAPSLSVGNDSERLLFFAVGPGQSWNVTTQEATVQKRTEWVVRS